MGVGPLGWLGLVGPRALPAHADQAFEVKNIVIKDFPYGFSDGPHKGII